MKTWLNASIQNRLIAFSGLAMAALVIVGLAYSYEKAALSSAGAEYDANLSLVQSSQLIETNSLQMRRREKDFLLRKDLKYIKKYKKAQAIVLKSLEDLKNDAHAAAFKDRVEALQAGIQKHGERFEALGAAYTEAGLNEKSGLKGTLRKAVHQVEEELKAHQQDALMVQMLMLRRHEKDYMLRGKQKYVDRVTKRVETFKTLLAASPLTDEQKANLVTLIEAYRDAFTAWTAKDQEINAITSELSTIYASLVPHWEAIATEAQQGLVQARESQASTRQQTSILIYGTGIVILVLFVALGRVLGRSITRPLVNLEKSMLDLADGQNQAEVPELDRADEIGLMARAVDVFREASVELDELQAQQQRDLEKSQAQTRRLEELTQGFRAQVSERLSQVGQASALMEHTARTMTTTAEETTTQAATVRSAAGQAAESVQVVASAAEELASSINEISRQTDESASVVRTAVEGTSRSQEAVDRLKAAGAHIGNVLQLINDIAEQTNLLALNATIEAARAGEAGKGFAVVADEVKNLAGQTSSSTEDISKQINALHGASRDVLEQISAIGQVIQQVDEITGRIAAAVTEQGAATQEIARNVLTVSEGTQAVNGAIVEVNEASNRTGVAASEALTAAQIVKKETSELSAAVEDFLTNVASMGNQAELAAA